MPDLAKAVKTVDDASLTEMVMEGEGGNTTVSARLISNPAGTDKYYVDTRDAESKLVIGKQIEYT
jgi:hypothetical protein